MVADQVLIYYVEFVIKCRSDICLLPGIHSVRDFSFYSFVRWFDYDMYQKTYEVGLLHRNQLTVGHGGGYFLLVIQSIGFLVGGLCVMASSFALAGDLAKASRT